MNDLITLPISTAPIATQSAIRRSNADGYARDMAWIMNHLSDTAKAKFFDLAMAGNHAAMGKFLDNEMNHYRVNRGHA